MGKLKEKWFPDQMVLYEWYSYCQNDFFHEILFEKTDHTPAMESSNLIKIDKSEKERFNKEEFDTLTYMLDTREHNCDICYTEFIGSSNFLALSGCMHFFCKTCVNLYVTDLITQGEIHRVSCPSFSGCKTPLTEHNLREIDLPQALIDKFNEFSINHAIAGMDEFSWCPLPHCG